MCPNQGKREWEDLRINAPKDFRKAVELESAIQLKDEHVFLTSTGKALKDSDFSNEKDEGSCMSGMCYV